MSKINDGDIVMGGDGYIILSDLGNLVVGDGRTVSIPPASTEKPMYVLIANKPDENSAFPDGLKAKDMFIHTNPAGMILEAGDSVYYAMGDRSYPAKSSSITTEPIKQDATTQKDGEFKNEKDTGRYTTSVEITALLEKGNGMQIEQLNSAFKMVETTADGNIIVAERTPRYAFLIINYIDSQVDTDYAVGCVVKFNGVPVTTDLEAAIEWNVSASIYTEISKPTFLIHNKQ